MSNASQIFGTIFQIFGGLLFTHGTAQTAFVRAVPPPLIERVSIECRNTKTTLSLWPITKDVDSHVHQSKLKANICSQCEARENRVYEGVTLGFGLTSDWLKNWHEM